MIPLLLVLCGATPDFNAAELKALGKRDLGAFQLKCTGAASASARGACSDAYPELLRGTPPRNADVQRYLEGLSKKDKPRALQLAAELGRDQDIDADLRAEALLGKVKLLKGKPEATVTLREAMALQPDSLRMMSMYLETVRADSSLGVNAESRLRAGCELLGPVQAVSCLQRSGLREPKQMLALSLNQPVFEAGTFLSSLSPSQAKPFDELFERCGRKPSMQGEQFEVMREVEQLPPDGIPLPVVGEWLAKSGFAQRDPFVRRCVLRRALAACTSAQLKGTRTACGPSTAAALIALGESLQLTPADYQQFLEDVFNAKTGMYERAGIGTEAQVLASRQSLLQLHVGLANLLSVQGENGGFRTVKFQAGRAWELWKELNAPAALPEGLLPCTPPDGCTTRGVAPKRSPKTFLALAAFANIPVAQEAVLVVTKDATLEALLLERCRDGNPVCRKEVASKVLRRQILDAAGTDLDGEKHQIVRVQGVVKVDGVPVTEITERVYLSDMPLP